MSVVHETIDGEIAAAVAVGDILGASVALIEDGRVAFVGGYGVAVAGEPEAPGKPVAPGKPAAKVGVETAFAYGSISKVICALLVMRLVEAGYVVLDRPLVGYLPGLSFSNKAYGERLTLRHVLSHTTGLPAAGRYYGPLGKGALREVVEAELPGYPFVAAPGELSLYSNTVFCVAGYAAEVVMGKPYDALVQEWVYDPLGMGEVTFDQRRLKRGQVALSHEAVDGVWRPIERLPANDAGLPSSFAYGPAGDLARMACMMAAGGRYEGKAFLSEASLREMARMHGSRYVAGASHPLAYVTGGYGLGLMVGDYQGVGVWRHGGMSQSHNCFFELFPERGSGFVLLTNASEEARLMDVVVAIYDQMLDMRGEGTRLVAAPALFEDVEERQRWEGYAGDYLNVEWGGRIKVFIENETLMMRQDGGKMALHCIGVGRYYAMLGEGRRAPLAFVGSEQGAARHMVYVGAPYHRYERGNGGGVDAGTLDDYCGFYRDPFNRDDGDVLRLWMAEGQLWIQEGEGEGVVCEAVGELAFCCDLGFFELEWEADREAPVLLWGKATRYEYVARD